MAINKHIHMAINKHVNTYMTCTVFSIYTHKLYTYTTSTNFDWDSLRGPMAEPEWLGVLAQWWRNGDRMGAKDWQMS